MFVLPYRGCRAGAGANVRAAISWVQGRGGSGFGRADRLVLQRRPGCRRAAGGLDRVRSEHVLLATLGGVLSAVFDSSFAILGSKSDLIGAMMSASLVSRT